MPKQGKTTEFWERLTLARTTCKPALSMRQEDIAKDAGAKFQSAVTDWKTGGENGTTKPRPETAEKLARQANVSFEWLYTGRGEMRPRAAPDAITQQILEALDSLPPDAKLEVLKAAFTQQTLMHPAVAAQMRQAERAAEQLANPRRERQTR